MILSMHVQFKDKTRAEVTAPLLTPAALKLMDGEVNCHGMVFRSHGMTVTKEIANEPNSLR